MAQPILILFFVYWLWNRYDISLDAIIKFFTAGFLVATSNAIVCEFLVSIVASLAVVVTALVGALILLATGQIDVAPTNSTSYMTFGGVAGGTVGNAANQTNQGTSHLQVPDAFLYVLAMLSAFLNAFVVAALVEETGKYLSFWMVEHADVEVDEVDDDDDQRPHPLPLGSPADDQLTVECSNTTTSQPKRSLVSRGAAITIAMVAVALGFTCCENLLYVFVYTPPGMANEISTLVARCLFPVHPICAAIQSIGVVRRDLERQSNIGIGLIILPAWLLHGSFDFLQMAVAAYFSVQRRLSDQSTTTNPKSSSTTFPEPTAAPTASQSSSSSWQAAIPLFLASMVIVLLGLIYYICAAWAQRRRLRALEAQS